MGDVDGTAEKLHTVLSFDIGTVNFAYCVLSVTTCETPPRFLIKEWQVLNINARTMTDIAYNLLDVLPELITDDIDAVVIETQGQHAKSKMRGISYMLLMHFLTLFRGTRREGCAYMISAKFKLQVYQGKEKTPVAKLNYKERKQLAIKHCRCVLTEQEDAKYLELFETHEKQDDLADCFLQGAYYLLHQAKFKPKKKRKPVPQVARKAKKVKVTAKPVGRIIDLTEDSV